MSTNVTCPPVWLSSASVKYIFNQTIKNDYDH